MTKTERRALLYFARVMRGERHQVALTRLWHLALYLLPDPTFTGWPGRVDIAESMAHAWERS